MSRAPELRPDADPEAVLAPRLEQRIVPGLERTAAALEAFGHPERTFPSVVIVGTNGKGSTAAFLSSMLQAHGLSVGLYTSPHLVRLAERIRVDGRPVGNHRLARLLLDLERFPELSFFEALTVAALREFAARRVDLAVLEAGLGGRWDAVNAVDPVVSLLTNVGTDHASWLGPTRLAIAAEKAAALRGSEAVVGCWDAEVETAIRALATPRERLSLASERAVLDEAGRDVRFRVAEATGTASVPLLGDHQRDNLRLALAGLAALHDQGVVAGPDPDAVRHGIESTRWPGRLQWVESAGRRLLLDGAHNREATAALARALDGGAAGVAPHLLFSCLADKPLAAMAELLRPRTAAVTVAPLDGPRAMPADDLAAAFPGAAVATDVAAALERLPRERPTLVTGSIRLVGAVLALRNGG